MYHEKSFGYGIPIAFFGSLISQRNLKKAKRVGGITRVLLHERKTVMMKAMWMNEILLCLIVFLMSAIKLTTLRFNLFE